MLLMFCSLSLLVVTKFRSFSIAPLIIDTG